MSPIQAKNYAGPTDYTSLSTFVFVYCEKFCSHFTLNRIPLQTVPHALQSSEFALLDAIPHPLLVAPAQKLAEQQQIHGSREESFS
jgi:hypothetical protein